MAKSKELDNLSLDMMECKKAGYGCHYGKWKAMQKEKEVKKIEAVPEGWQVCEWCGKAYKPRTKKLQKYCEPYCANESQKKKRREKKAEYMREYRAKRGKENGKE